MNRNGLTLIELMFAIAIIGILLAIGTLDFNQMTRKYAIEAQTREMYSDLVDLRLKAMYKKRAHAAKLTATTFNAYSSQNTSGTPIGLMYTKNLKYQITYSNTMATISFDSHGLTTDLGCICTEPSGNPGGVDSVVFSYMTQFNIGKRSTGGDCKSVNIEIR